MGGTARQEKGAEFGRTQQVWAVPLWVASRLDLAGLKADPAHPEEF